MVRGIHEKATFGGFDRESQRFSSGPITVVRSRKSTDQGVEVAFAVPRKVGPAVIRNRLRRQIRAAVDELLTDSAVPVGSYLVIVRAKARGSEYTDIRNWLSGAFSRMAVDVTTS